MDQDIISIAPAAKRWLQQSQIARVLHVFDPVCNLINEEGDVFSLVGPFVGNGPFSGLTERGIFTSWIRAESTIKLGTHSFTIDGNRVSFERATLWEPHPNWDMLKSSSKQLQEASDSIEELLKEHAPSESFAHVVLPLRQSGELDSKTHEKARVAIDALLPAIIDENSEIIRASASDLGGLGPGLTPAGDDFLVGLMHALWAILPQTQALVLSLILAESAVPRTNSLSAAWLSAASKGKAGEPWHELIAAIPSNESDAIESAVMRILPTGHSSGADALGGFVALVRLLVVMEEG